MKLSYRYMRFPKGRFKALTFSYDDGCKSDIRLAEIFAKYKVFGTFNLNNFVSEQKMNKEDVIRYIIDNGHEVALHGAMHKAPGRVRAIDAIRDILQNREELEEKFNMIIRGMAYPDSGIRKMIIGTDYESIKSYISKLDVVYSRTLGSDNNSFTLPSDFYAWMPSAHHNNENLMKWADEFLNLTIPEYAALRESKLFYVWGHSFEFERDNNWDLIDDFCKKLSGRDDIWYATNIEICEYTMAYNSLIYSADGKIIKNPTLMEIWFEDNGVLYDIKPGETLNLRKD